MKRHGTLNRRSIVITSASSSARDYYSLVKFSVKIRSVILLETRNSFIAEPRKAREGAP